MSNKMPDDKDGLLETIKKLWLPIAGFIGAVTLAYNFYKMWLGDQEAVSYITAGAGLIIVVGVLVWVGFGFRNVTREAVWPVGSTKTERLWLYPLIARRIARSLTAFVFLSLAVGNFLYIQHRLELKDKLVIVIAKFDGPEEDYHLRDTIYQKLRTTTKDYGDTTIVTVDDLVTEILGSDLARKIGEREHADLVIWAWYTKTENSNLNLYVENLSPSQFNIAKDGEPYKPDASLADLESLEIQTQLASEITDLVSFLVGYTRYKVGDYSTALVLFNSVLQKGEISSLIDKGTILFLAGNCNFLDQHYHLSISNYSDSLLADPLADETFYNRGVSYQELGQDDQALDDYSQAIFLNPLNANAYNNRGIIYAKLGDYEQAIDNFNRAIESDKSIKSEDADRHYYNRGLTYAKINQYDQAISDYTLALNLNPNLVEAVANRGVAYYTTDQYDKAIRDFDLAIDLRPADPSLYNNRGTTYDVKGEHQKALADFNKAIEIDPNFGPAYISRGAAYFFEGKYQFAIIDFNKAIVLNPFDAEAYRSRGYTYQTIGKTVEAQADFEKYEELTGEKP